MERNNYHKKAILAIILFILFAGFCTVAFATNPLSNGVLDNVDPNDLLLIKRNGIVSAICYMTDLLTGPVSKVIMCLFFVAFGFMLIYGGKFNYVRIIVVTIVVAILYGGKSIVDIVSGNKYSCKSLKYVAENSDGVAENIGFCYVNSIEEYKVAQTWKKCDTKGKNCTTSINATVEINENDIVSLTSCGSTYYASTGGPSESIYLKYKCVRLEDKSYKFEKVSGSKLVCNKYCDKSKLITFLMQNKKYTLLGEDGKAINRDDTPTIITGNTVSMYGWTQGTLLKIGCTSENTLVNNDINKDFGLLCNDKAEFEVQGGTCASICQISKLANNNIAIAQNVKTWDLYIGNKTLSVAQAGVINKDNIEIENSELKTLPESSYNKITSGQVVRVNECNDGYSIQNTTKKAMFKCDDGQWRRVNVDDNEENTFCESQCKLADIKNADLIENILLNDKVTDRTSFYPNEEIVISTCKGNASNNKNGTNMERYSTSPAKLSCSSGGSWINENNGEYCENYCKFSVQSKEYKNILYWKLYDKEGNKYANMENNDIVLSNTSQIFYEGEQLVASTPENSENACASGFIYRPGLTPPTYICTNGKLKLKEGDSDICINQCKVTPTISTITNINNNYANILGLSYCGTSKDNCTFMIFSRNPKYKTEEGKATVETACGAGSEDNANIINDENIAYIGCKREYYTGDYVVAEACGSKQQKVLFNNSVDSTSATIFKCDETGNWVAEQNSFYCIPKCEFDEIRTDTSDGELSAVIDNWSYCPNGQNCTQLTVEQIITENDTIQCTSDDEKCKDSSGNPIVLKCTNVGGNGIWSK